MTTMSTQKRIDMWNSIYLLEPDAAPLWTLINRLSQRACLNPKISWVFNSHSHPSVATTETNVCQIFRKGVVLTSTLMNSSLYAFSDRQYARKKRGIELLRDFETTLFFGQRNLALGLIPNTMGGLVFFTDIHSVYDRSVLPSTLNEMDLNQYLLSAFRYGPPVRYFFSGVKPLFVKGASTRGVPTTNTYGVKVEQYFSPHGTVNLIHDPMLGDFAVLLNLSSLHLCYLQGRGAHLLTNIQAPGDDYVKDGYISEWSVEVSQPDDVVYFGIPAVTGTPGVAEGSTFDSMYHTGDEVDSGYDPSLDSIVGLEDPLWRGR